MGRRFFKWRKTVINEVYTFIQINIGGVTRDIPNNKLGQCSGLVEMVCLCRFHHHRNNSIQGLSQKQKSMSAPKGNKFWEKRSKHGRDKIFKTPDILWETACEYFEWCQANPLQEEQLIKLKDSIKRENLNKMRPFTLKGLCIFMGVHSTYFHEFEQGLKGKDDQLSQDFSQITKRIRDIIFTQKFDGAASGFFNNNIIARDLGLVDKSEGKTKLQINPYEDMSIERLQEEINRLTDEEG